MVWSVKISTIGWFKTVKRFVADQAGSITPLILPLFLLLIFATGFAIDLVRFEAQRADLQNALDRGVLAATALNQELPAQEIVDDYLDTRTFANYEAVSQVTPSGNAGTRTIDASAQYEFNTAFMNMVGVPDIGLGAGAAATEGAGLIEISLVLDISGSMAREYTGETTSSRLEVLKAAASEFIDTMLAPGAEQYTTVSLIPYSGQVNAGPFFDLMLSGSREHDYSSCVSFSDLDYDSVELPPQNSLSQVQHFQWFAYERLRGQTGFPFDPDGGRNAEWGWCPSDDNALLPFSTDAQELKDRIEGFVGHDGTGTQNGMKWGLALLSEDTQPLMQQLALQGKVPATVANRPHALTDSSVQKIVVLMTDGRIRYQQSIKPEYYDTQEEIDYFAFNEDELACCSGGNLYAKNQLARHASKTSLNTSTLRTADETNRREQFGALCDVARQKGVRVYTIGFDIEASSSAHSDMSACATTSADFFDVDGLELFDAFSQITVDIQKLKLVLR